MRIDNSAFQAFWRCPTYYRYGSRDGLHKTLSYLEFGQRFHKLLEFHYQPDDNRLAELALHDTPLADERLEDEVQVMLEAYKAAYPTESFEVLECERAFELELPFKGWSCRKCGAGFSLLPDGNRVVCVDCDAIYASHHYLGKIDMLVRENDKLKVFETKTESRSSKRNLPQAWAARTQASLYTWAASQIYGEPIDSIVLNICTKASPKGQVGPSFRRDVLERTSQQVEQALKDLIWVADRLEEIQESGVYPRNTNSCVGEYGYPCDFYLPCHAGGMTPEVLASYTQIDQFSHLEL